MAILECVLLPVLNDNYIYLINDAETGFTAAVDPAEADAVIDACKTRGWTLTHILNTHHHADHVGGNLTLKDTFNCAILGAVHDIERLPGVDTPVKDGETITLNGHNVEVLAVPGHTMGHIAYHFPDDGYLFCGDALFSMGCGRMFEGTPEQMTSSLAKFLALPDDTLVCPAHEYTEANGRFALSVDASNEALQNRMEIVGILRSRGDATVPSSIGMEKATNPFLRLDDNNIRATLNMVDAPDYEVFRKLREMKDHFRG
ncbi:MAG: hydroxyacylglutathione hydrolase [Sphingomonadales bacterium]|nr:hydroxyacylglutathione hydrolase [Sphingomonadales bacterium]